MHKHFLIVIQMLKKLLSAEFFLGKDWYVIPQYLLKPLRNPSPEMSLLLIFIQISAACIGETECSLEMFSRIRIDSASQLHVLNYLQRRIKMMAKNDLVSYTVSK